MLLESIKNKNEIILKNKNIVTNSNLPIIEPLTEVKLRTAVDVASRACALGYVVGLAFDADPDDLIQQLTDFSLWDFVTQKERELLRKEKLSEKEVNQVSRLVESIQALAWCLGLIEMDHFDECSDELASKFPMGEDPKNFIKRAKLVSTTQFQESCDFLYRLHWASVQGQELPVAPALIEQRRIALDWVYGVEEDWDEISLDT